MKIKTKHFEDRIKSLDKREIEEKLDSFYEASYGPMIEFFNSKKEKFNKTAFYQALPMVYGWMPIIPFSKKVKSKDGVESDKDTKTKFIDMTDSIASDLGKAYDHTRSTFFSLSELIKFSKYTNNSIVGLSKMLHFMNPNVYPIWDSNISRVFDLKWQNQINNAENYLNYTIAMHNIAHPNENLRDIEKQLFLLGKSLKSNESGTPNNG